MENFVNMDEGKTSTEFILEGQRHERVYNQWTALASYELAGEEGKKHREALIRREATKNPTRAYLMTNEEEKDLMRFIQVQADKRKLELLRDHIRKNL